MNVVVPGLLGYPGSASVLLFPADPRGIPGDIVPRSLALPGSSSRQLRALSRVWCYLGPVNRPQPTNTFPRVSSFFATTVLGVHCSVSIPSSPTFRPQRFPRSRRLTPPHTWRAYFIPHAACKVRPTGAFPDTQPIWLVASSYSLDLLTSRPLQLSELTCASA